MKKVSVLISTLVVTSAVLSACGENEVDTNLSNNEEAENDSIETIEIMTTLFPLEDFANRIGGEYVEVENIVPVGSDVHTFEPTANQMIGLAEADLFIYNGADYEGFSDSIIDAVDSHDVKILTASDGIDLIEYDHNKQDYGENNDHEDENNDHEHENNNNDHDHDHDHEHGENDPHVWLDPIRAIELAENIKDALVEVRPAAEEEFNLNFEELKTDLEELDDNFQGMVDEMTQDTMIVSHAAYGYWKDRYDINQIAISGLSSTNEPTIQQIQEVISFMESNDISYVMFEQNIPTNIAETVREQVGAEELWLHNLSALINENIENEDDYFSLMEKNIETLRKALQ
ncbi:ABC transporter substrate-binding protein [Salipaludibacillus neizhouensis]|uniref:ABC transporter substrate-binding protein n=1 Tax=Salipaludibacillus neizhouensis TaxID=885475 RepID=A0A3A9K1K0_9BACI|nr:zinc ABC transporter substrate-binding protein [Salipaludibacillus neizhouensis]RKL66974.1 ABC transporter substrate-binding protein [Salipaludibacillus neizhouensis]